MTEQSPKVNRGGGWEYWTTVTYRSVILIIVALLIMGLSFWILFFRDSFDSFVARISGAGAEAGTENRTASARFANLDGTVRVKKKTSVQWQNADYNMMLEEGDIIQTGSQGIARIVFPDNTTYVVKPETLIVIEENATLSTQATKVAVQVSSGAVDLSTGSWDVPGSTSEVRFENAVARMNENTRAAIRQDPEANIHEITVSEGKAAVSKGRQTVQIGPYERAGFRDPNESLRKEKVLAPPELTRPRNLEPIISSNPAGEVIRFDWQPVEKAVAYQLRLSTSPLFTSEVLNRRVNGTAFSTRGLAPGDYYWTVRAVDAAGGESPEAEARRFTLAEQPATEQLLLVIDNIIQHGRVIEIVGRTEPGARVTINAEPVALVQPDGSFRHFTSPLLGPGAHTISIVAQNARGEVVTRKQPVLVK
jgi:hypothetical protein